MVLYVTFPLYPLLQRKLINQTTSSKLKETLIPSSSFVSQPSSLTNHNNPGELCNLQLILQISSTVGSTNASCQPWPGGQTGRPILTTDNPISTFCPPHGTVNGKGIRLNMKGLIFCVLAVMVLIPAQGKMTKVHRKHRPDDFFYSISATSTVLFCSLNWE